MIVFKHHKYNDKFKITQKKQKISNQTYKFGVKKITQ